MFKITATGGDARTLVITDTATGAVIKDPVLQNLTVQFRSDGEIIATGHVAVFAPDLEADRMDWVAMHPLTRQIAPLAALEFRDGARIEFAPNGAASVKEVRRPERVTVSLDAVFDARAMLHAVAKSLFGGDVPAPAADVSTTEMTEAIAFHLRLMATPISKEVGELLAASAATLTDVAGKPVEVPHANFWTVLRPAAVVSDTSLEHAVSPAPAGWRLPGGPEASVLISRYDRLGGGTYYSLSWPPSLTETRSTVGAAINMAEEAFHRGFTLNNAPVNGGVPDSFSDPHATRWVRIDRWGRYFTVNTSPAHDGSCCGLTPVTDFQRVREFATQYLTIGEVTGESTAHLNEAASDASVILDFRRYPADYEADRSARCPLPISSV